MKITNVERLKAKIARIPVATREEIRAAIAVSAQEIVGLQKRFVPKKTGALEKSIGYTFGAYRPDNANVRGVSAPGAGHDLSVTIHAGDKTAYYAAFVEFGTTSHEAGGKFDGATIPAVTAQPFFYPGYRIGKKRAKSRISRAVTKAAKKVAAGG
jgi:HK97 gp10 family phage protein